MGTVHRLYDGLRNAITGAGTRRDPRASNTYNPPRYFTQHEIDAAYRGSGLMRKIIQIPAMDMVREWRCWETDKETIAKIEAEEKRLAIKQKIRMAEVLRGLGGGALILGLPGNPSEPAPESVGLDGLSYVHVVSRWHLTYEQLEEDARLPGYGEPSMWRLAQIGGQATIHPSRVIPFRADTSAMLASTMATGPDVFWGESRVAQVLDAVSDSDAARGAFASMLHKARLTRIGLPGLGDILSRPGGQETVQARLEVIALAESMFNVSIYDSGANKDGGGEKIDDVTYTFAGAKDILNAYFEFVSAISDIPATRLLGRAPEGMNSSGDSQQKDWNKRIKALQELELAPCLDRLDPYLLASAGAPIDTVSEFEELEEEDKNADATRFKATVDAMNVIETMGFVPATAFTKAAQNTLVQGGWMPGLDAALEEIPEAERFGINAQPDPMQGDPTQSKGGDPIAGAQGAKPAAVVATDAAPRSLYVQRKLVNAQEFIAWAKAQGFDSTLAADELHVTIAYSTQPVDWMKVESAWDGPDGQLVVSPGGARLVEPLGDKGAVVLLFNSSDLAWRHKCIINAGASHDFEDYQPHVTISYAKPEGLDLAKVEPFRGKLIFGPEIFEEIKNAWQASIEEA